MANQKEQKKDQVVDQVEQQPTLDLEQLKAQIKAELQAEMQKEVEAKQKALEEKLAKEEKEIEKKLAEQEKHTKAKLAEEKKVPIHIPEDPLNPDDVVPVGINGVIYAIPRGQTFDVPESIYKAWKYSHDETVKANKKIKFEQNKKVQVLV